MDETINVTTNCEPTEPDRASETGKAVICTAVRELTYRKQHFALRKCVILH